MNWLHPYKRIVPIIFIVIAITVLVLLTNPVFAQGTEPTQPPQATEAPATDSDTATATPASELLPFLRSNQFFNLTFTVLMIALGMWGILFLYTYSIHTRYYAAAIEALNKGYTAVPSVIGTGAFESLPGLENVELKIEGPQNITVGVESGEYKILGASVLAEAKWSVEPASAAIVLSPDQPMTKVRAAINGAFNLIAEVKLNVDDPKYIKGSMSVIALTPEVSKKIDLPVFGRSYGTIAIAIVVLALVLILGLGTILPEGSIATLLGTLIAYIFSRTSPTPPGGSGTSAPPADDV
jgi:hypothetical protein